jgi:malonate transporter
MLIALSILPLLLTISCGYIIAATKILPSDRWDAIETLSFRLLIPVLLIRAISVSEFSLSRFGPLIWMLIVALSLAGLIALTLRWIFNHRQLPNPAFTTLFQTTTRWNAFIALAAAEQFIGPEGIALIAVAMAVLIPLINIANITVLAVFGDGHTSARHTAMMVIKNPLVQACLIGLALNFSAIEIPQAAMQTLDLIGRAAFGVGLLAVGAGIDPKRLLKGSFAVWLGTLLRLVLCPSLFLALAYLFALGPVQTLAGVLILAVPAAPNGYIVAKQMGGDADLYADILTWQTVLAMALLPLLAVFLSVQ